MPKTPEDLLRRLDELKIDATTHRHPPVFTVEENKRLRGTLPGTHIKNLFLKDKKGALWLVVTLEDRAIDMKDLRRRLGAAQLSFGRPEVLREALGIDPGSVTPFAVINDPDGRVTVVLDRDLMEAETVNCHPLSNDATTAIAPEDLLRFLEACGHEPRIMAL